jgi:hypothetical protein
MISSAVGSLVACFFALVVVVTRRSIDMSASSFNSPDFTVTSLPLHSCE